jgi:hypothetical protein
MIIPMIDCVNSTWGNSLSKNDCGLNTPNRRAPLASGGNTKGITMMICATDLPGNLYLDKQYAKGMPNNAISKVDIDAVLMLKIKASKILGLIRDANKLLGSTKIKILKSG